jgi:hypothetical protein
MATWSTLKKVTVALAAVAFAALALSFTADRVHRFASMGARSKQSEARVRLKVVYTCMRSYFQEKDTYLADARAIGFELERGNRYTYFLAPGGPVEHRSAQIAVPPAADAGVAVIANDVFKMGGDEVTTAAQTGCKVTPGKDEEGHQITLGVTPGLKGGFVALAARLGEEVVTGKKGAFDCWSVASMDRTTASGEKIPAGMPYNETTGGW